ncbi:hypothetical protein DICPUDRAFT_94241 [Dictyostelium purpureum]|uniref:NAD-dependent epimerase/dehydratase domain-containing protein n=1 Tax=Dictyostelium purpureum TaxID=5786 RepID=F0ZH18_DICPU|nr:uncharacterized protein DICPUDRAFT_94241 [Dictyostelium purpureum]EGC36777.1 hypothetical protein DICPUDRAFT_94241 [Dictyostelium purpureum]|eukprot:XP_003286723.1 hypothetical protein DICPUDRAFT_94241 [Dictyostelium purpureum]
MSKLIAVTGATGFLGHYIVRDLLNKGYRVLALVRDPKNEEKLKSLKYFNQSGDDSRLFFDGGDLEKVDYGKLFEGVDGVIHTASPFIYSSEDADRDIILPAINGTLRVLEAAAKNPTVGKVVITSSGLAVYNAFGGEIKSEYSDDDWANPPKSTPYPYSKVAAEKAAWEFIEKNNQDPTTNHFNLSVINPGFFIGPNAGISTTLNTSVNLIIQQLFNASPIRQVAVAFVNVQDVSNAHIFALENEGANNKRMLNVHRVINFKDMALTAMKLFPEFKYNASPIPEDSNIFKLEPKRLNSLGFTDYISLDETIKTMIQQLLDTKAINPEKK